uniref:Uncharacterized protein n=1 Tax=Lotharella globosa TaxID=91324 RepID=A0A7S3Z2I2_9EUKA
MMKMRMNMKRFNPPAHHQELRPSGGGKGGGEENHHMMTILVVSASIFTVVVIGAVVTALCFRSRSPLWYNPVPAVGVNVVELEGNNENPPPSHSADGDKAIRAGDATSSIHKINDSMMEARSHHELQTAL